MVRYIYRRTSLAAALLCVASLCIADPITPRRMTVNPNWQAAQIAKKPRRGHADQKVWTQEIQWAISNREEVKHWIEKWSTEEELNKIKQSTMRVFDIQRDIFAILRNAHIPWSLSVIPIVESNWRTEAISSSGAAGPWQFLEISGRGRNLIIDAWRDERRDYWRSTEAAAAELNFNYRLLKDWVLAIAAYNGGPTRIRKLRESKSYADFWDMLDAGIIPPETQSYVPKVIAVAYILAHAGRLGLPVTWKPPREWSRVKLGKSIHLKQLAEITGLDDQFIKKVHPELQHPITPPPSETYFVKVPKNLKEITTVWMEILSNNDSPPRFWRYTIKSGDTLTGLAFRFDIPMEELIRYNNNIIAGQLRIGERIFLPGDDIPPEGLVVETVNNWTAKYKVKPGDSLWSISREYDISPESLAEANHRSIGSLLMSGSILKVPDRMNIHKEEIE